MFGYVVPNESELKLWQFEHYRSYYCGICRDLKEMHGRSGQITLSYDTTFLALLLTSLYEPGDARDEIRCAVHPAKKHPTRRNIYTAYAADMNVLLSYYSCLDDWEDERQVRKYALSRMLKGTAASMSEKYPEKAAVMKKNLDLLHQAEKAGDQNLDKVSGCFGEIMAEIFAFKKDEWEATLRRMGFYLGKFIYLMDAYDDLDKDRKSGNYNPLLARENEPDFDEKCRELLTMMMAECCRSFEVLPVLENLDILRNILYSGVWSRFNAIMEEKNKKKGSEDNV